MIVPEWCNSYLLYFQCSSANCWEMGAICLLSAHHFLKSWCGIGTIVSKFSQNFVKFLGVKFCQSVDTVTTETFVTTYDNCEITLSPFQLTYTPKVSIGTIPTCFSNVTCDAGSPDISKMYENLESTLLPVIQRICLPKSVHVQKFNWIDGHGVYVLLMSVGLTWD